MGTRLVIWGRVIAILGVVLLVLVGAKTYLAFTKHDLGAATMTGLAGGALAIAMVSVGESLTRTGVRWLRSQEHIARSLGRIIGRRTNLQRRY